MNGFCWISWLIAVSTWERNDGLVVSHLAFGSPFPRAHVVPGTGVGVGVGAGAGGGVDGGVAGVVATGEPPPPPQASSVTPRASRTLAAARLLFSPIISPSRNPRWRAGRRPARNTADKGYL